MATQQEKQAYEILGLVEGKVTSSSLHKTYKDKAKECHPDKPNGSAKAFKEVKQAYDVLKPTIKAKDTAKVLTKGMFSKFKLG